MYETVCGTIKSLPGQAFDTIIYVDVLEHIENDRNELNAAASYLRRNGHLIVVAPAHQWLFTPFDAAIGHFRRYNRPMLQEVTPPGLQVERVRYLDSVGLGASAANRLFLRQSMPTQSQLRFWDHWMVPASRFLDSLLLFRVGKTILVAWRRL
jgi:2-polyprenyl-3-methyl-5-hydroxy-6-metoxy-1,4-benzoquinol methylase